jgi:hypothetical protein
MDSSGQASRAGTSTDSHHSARVAHRVATKMERSALPSSKNPVFSRFSGGCSNPSGPTFVSRYFKMRYEDNRNEEGTSVWPQHSTNTPHCVCRVPASQQETAAGRLAAVVPCLGYMLTSRRSREVLGREAARPLCPVVGPCCPVHSSKPKLRLVSNRVERMPVSLALWYESDAWDHTLPV